MEDISVNQLAEMLYVSPYHLCHEFKRGNRQDDHPVFEHNPDTACPDTDALESDYNITQISREVGFSNLTHFNRTFKKVTGVNPSEKKETVQNRMKDGSSPEQIGAVALNN